jgi:outer membrane protein OmpA-like peptidoglycan-associated protein
VRDYLVANPDVSLLRVVAHADDRGARTYAMDLAARRALAVALRLRAAGIDCHRLLPIALLPESPPNDITQDRRRDRRIVFVVAARGGRALPDWGIHAGDPCQ